VVLLKISRCAFLIRPRINKYSKIISTTSPSIQNFPKAHSLESIDFNLANALAVAPGVLSLGKLTKTLKMS
jgi:hypothetical protein